MMVSQTARIRWDDIGEALPAVVVLIAMHIVIIRLQGVTEFQFEDESEEAPKHFSLYPDHVFTELMIGLLLMILLSAMATIMPAAKSSSCSRANLATSTAAIPLGPGYGIPRAVDTRHSVNRAA